MARTKTAQAAIDRLYATLATAAAQRSVKRIEIGDSEEADRWAGIAVKYLDKTHADAIRWHYTNPRTGT